MQARFYILNITITIKLIFDQFDNVSTCEFVSFVNMNLAKMCLDT